MDAIRVNMGEFPMGQSEQDITGLLKRWSSGDRGGLDELIPIIYSELHKLAGHYLDREHDTPTLQTTALVNEAWIRLARQHSAEWQNRAQFFGVAARIMRRILVDHARERDAARRGGGAARIALDEVLMVPSARDQDLVALDAALVDLASFDPQKARVVEMRYFGGMTIEEVAEAMATSPTTVKREWAVARVGFTGG